MKNKLGKNFWLSLFFLFSLSDQLRASETDQFYATNAVIKDSSDVINDYFHQSIDEGIEKANLKRKFVPCRKVATYVLTQVLGEFSVKKYVHDKTYSKVSHFIKSSPLIDRFPHDDIDGKEYRLNSIYKKRPFPANSVGLSKTININGIYIGGDKIGHFSIIGRTYYKNFLDELEDGHTSDFAQISAIKKGFKEEVNILGYRIGGTFSFADLEANFMGLQFARNMCEGKRPHLILKNDVWIHNPSNLFDIKKYINPKMDEAYNVSLWAPHLWKKIKGDLVSAYCKNSIDQDFLNRASFYKNQLVDTINDQLIQEFLKKNVKFDRSHQLLSGFYCK
jgi:hypothetical protein